MTSSQRHSACRLVHGMNFLKKASTLSNARVIKVAVDEVFLSFDPRIGRVNHKLKDINEVCTAYEVCISLPTCFRSPSQLLVCPIIVSNAFETFCFFLFSFPSPGSLTTQPE